MSGGLSAALCRAFYILCQWGRLENKQSALRFFGFYFGVGFFTHDETINYTYTSVYQKWRYSQETGRGPYVQVDIFTKCSISRSRSGLISQLSHTTGHRTHGKSQEVRPSPYWVLAMKTGILSQSMIFSEP